MKDRIALGMVEAAEKAGKLLHGGTIIEPTSGDVYKRQVSYRVRGERGKILQSGEGNNVELGLRNAEKSRTRRKYESATNSICLLYTSR